MKKSCTAWLMVWLAASAGVYYFVSQRIPVPKLLIIASVGGGFLVMMGLAYWWGIIDVVKQRARLRRSLAGEGFEDGQRVTAFGRVVAQGSLLTSPFQQKPCVAYSYEIQGNRLKYYDGFAMNPCAIQTQGGTVRLLAWPELAYEGAYPFGEETKRRALDFIQSTQFRPFSGIRDALAQLRELRADDDGTMRYDHVMGAWDPNTSATFSEHILAPGDEVFATGRYSAMHQGFVPDPGEAVQSIKIQKGTMQQIAGSGTSPITYFILGAIFLGAAIFGLIMLFRLVPPGTTIF